MSQPKQQSYHKVALTIGTRRVLIHGITKNTTCRDVIKMVLKRLPFRKENGDGDSFGIFESSRGTEKLLSAQNKLVKVMRSWGPSSAREFVMKRISTMTKPVVSEAKRRKLTQSSSSHSNISHYSTQTTSSTSERMDENPTQMNKTYSVQHPNKDISTSGPAHVNDTSSRVPPVCGCCGPNRPRDVYSPSVPATRNVTGQSEHFTNVFETRNDTVVVTRVDKVKYAVRKSLKPKPTKTTYVPTTKSRYANILSEKQAELQSTPLDSRIHTKPTRSIVGKHDELAKHIKFQIDSMDQREGKEAILNRYFADYMMFQSPSRSSMCRGRGDGAESDDDDLRRGDGASYTCYSSRLPDNNVTRDTPYFTHDSDVDMSLNDSHNDTLNEAINVTRVTDYASDMDAISSDSGQEDGDFDVAFIDEQGVFLDDIPCHSKLVDYSLTESDLSDIPSDDQDNAISMGSVSDYVRSVFNDNIVGDEDEELDSFMVTKLADDITDEGLGSIGSDDEH